MLGFCEPSSCRVPGAALANRVGAADAGDRLVAGFPRVVLPRFDPLLLADPTFDGTAKVATGGWFAYELLIGSGAIVDGALFSVLLEDG